jgi:hypothetical protein
MDGFAKTAEAVKETKWWFHPTDSSVDVAVVPWTLGADEDVLTIPSSMFLTDEEIRRRRTGPGDEIFTIGLFSLMHGREKNIPIVRTGNVAMMPGPGDLVQTDRGESEAYLAEIRSIGGLSGSPVFVNETLEIGNVLKNHVTGEAEKTVMVCLGQYSFMGIVHGHWDTLPEHKNKPMVVLDKSRNRINLGIAVIVPAKKILEVINQPELLQQRRSAEEVHLKSQAPIPDALPS